MKNSVKQVILHAPNIHQGGGFTLLAALLECHSAVIKSVQVDQRLPLHLDQHDFRTIRVKASIWSRIRAEWRLRSVEHEDIVFCFANLPPLFGSPGRVVVFLQNRLLLEASSLPAYPCRVRLRLVVERLWLRFRLSESSIVIVQTESMRKLAFSNLGVKAVVRPFCKEAPVIGLKESSAEFDFIYVASGDPHKNHFRLLDAWRDLRFDGLRPSLLLTISEAKDPALFRAVKYYCEKYDLNIEMRTAFGQNQVFDLYLKSRCLIYPSLCESYGLPLIEAAALNVPIVASERDYVRDVCAPIETFDPESAISISRAVRRFLASRQEAARPLSPKEFLDLL